jgi:hypothetical protein
MMAHSSTLLSRAYSFAFVQELRWRWGAVARLLIVAVRLLIVVMETLLLIVAAAGNGGSRSIRAMQGGEWKTLRGISPLFITT